MVDILVRLLILGGWGRNHGLHLGLLGRLGGLGLSCLLLLDWRNNGFGLLDRGTDGGFDLWGLAVGVVPAETTSHDEQEGPAEIGVHGHFDYGYISNLTLHPPISSDRVHTVETWPPQ